MSTTGPVFDGEQGHGEQGHGDRTGAGRGVAHDVVHVVRHGEVHNPDRILYGRLADYHLSERGREMADRVAEHLADRDVRLVTASSLDRAQETAAPVAAAHGVGLHTDDRIIEAGNRFEGRRFGEGQGSLRNPGNWWLVRNPFRPSWGEPYAQIARRMQEAVADARRAAHRLYGGGEVVLVSHQLPIETLRRSLEGRHLWHDPRHRHCNLASVTTLTYAGDDLVSIAYSEPAADLLPGAASTPGA